MVATGIRLSCLRPVKAVSLQAQKTPSSRKTKRDFFSRQGLFLFWTTAIQTAIAAFLLSFSEKMAKNADFLDETDYYLRKNASVRKRALLRTFM
jgi:hypothetical protein